MIKRIIEQNIAKLLHKNRAILIYGARRTGKTTLLEAISEKIENVLTINCDFFEAQDLLEMKSVSDVKLRFGKYAYLLIDEAQRIKDIGIKLKMIIDTLPDLQIIATGSSSLELSNSINEPLTGRKFEFIMTPFSTEEIYNSFGIKEVFSNLHNRLVYGNYPEVLLGENLQDEILKEVASSYLFKDLLAYQDIKRPDLLKKLLQALAWQVGNQISYTELGSLIGLDKKTIERYIYLLEQCFIVFRLPSFSKNLRNELKRSVKLYFWDNGIRNAVINNLNPLHTRNDTGILWENYFISERRKYHLNHRIGFDHYFWRTAQQQEIDLIEIRGDDLFAFETKWNPNKKYRFPLTFTRAYPEAQQAVIHRNNYLEYFISEG